MRVALRVSLLGLLALSFGAAARAQVRDARVISAQAGGVNFVSGKVEFNREGAADWRALTDGVELGSGDVVRAGAGGRVEVLLNPGSYLRAGDGAEFELADDSLDDLRLKVLRGSAVVEATGYDGLGLSIFIDTPQTRVELIRTGIYRVNVLPSGATEVFVWEGRAQVGRRGEALVKGGRAATAAAGAEVVVAKFDKKNRDALDLWSRERGKELAKLNERFSRREVRTAFTGLDLLDWGYRYGGVWVAYGGCYTFLPYSAYWRSPYGFGYGSWYYTPRTYCAQCPSGGRVLGGGGARPYPTFGGGGGDGRRFPSGGQGGAAGPTSMPGRPEVAFPRQMPQSRPAPSMERAPAPGGMGRGRVRDQ